MTEPPRRMPPSPEERLRVVTRRMAPGSNDGQTRNARAVPRAGLPRNTLQQLPAGGTTGQELVKLSDDDYDYDWSDPPTPTGGGPVGAVKYADLTGISGSGYFSTDTLQQSVGDASSFSYSSQKIVLSGRDCWYQAYGDVQVSGGSPTVPLTVDLSISGSPAGAVFLAGDVVAYWPGYLSVGSSVGATSAPFYVSSSATAASVALRTVNPDGMSLFGYLYIVKLT